MISPEEAVMAGIGDLGTVDAHGMGAGEMNIFISTDQPERAF